MPDLKTYFTNKNIVVTGGVGSVGREIVAKLLKFSPKLVRVVDNNESGLFDMEMTYADHGNIEFYLADITDEREIRRTFSNMDMCFHSAALKHVPSCERSPFSAVNVNIQGCETVGRAAIEAGLDKVIFTSSDKAVNPTNVMGTTKLMGERLFTAMNFLRSHQSKTRFACTRFGNVLGSRGSVVPLFANQIAKGGPVTLTDDRMSRFVMTMSQSADLVIESMVLAKGGEVFITKMPVLRISDLARVMIDQLASLYGYAPSEIEVNTVGARPGEKMWEELSTEEEAGRLLEGEKFLVVLPAGHTRSQREQTYAYQEVRLEPSEVVYHSDRQPIMNDQQIAELLMQDAVLPSEVRTLVDSMQTGEQQ
ncbi:polysaccharide biosynthesis protein [Histidinibacterium aquaticum]|uniref:NAD-dependent epimerase/dehydratase family protein n=1 Tax=Histidinibacterium aquaticum TaxID=2613962 RepID=A0A5J5GAJ8_9RHOB|nr:polysaccharide biosynthesis protein [Histidinibacterium aquaticum]KAA9005058.1 NAD-dependent epimerase/dehydratase family protein [Histidinibacterium aquaticum]